MALPTIFLPTPPSDREKYLYVDRNRLWMYIFGIMSTLLLLVGGAVFALNHVFFLWYFFFIFVIAFYLGISYIIGIFSRSFDLDFHNQLVSTGSWFEPTVDVYLPSCGEDIEIIENTYKYVSQLDWPKEKLKVYVLDDSAREGVKTLADKYGFVYISRPNRGELKKAGNIRHAFPKTNGEFIVIYDADFCPRKEFLRELMPYFTDPFVALIQSPQFFTIDKNMTWVEKGASSIQELFYRLIQQNRNHWGGSICVGTNAIYRRSALKPYGGTYPIQHSEDVHTGFNLIKDGWELMYIPLNLAKGRCPDSVGAFFIQQYRWCMGSTSLFFNRELFWGHKMPLMRRICYLSGMTYYSATALGLFITALPGLLMVWFDPSHVVWYSLVFSFPSFLFSIFFMMFWNKSPFRLYTIRARFVSYYAHAFALYDKVRASVMEWVPTGDQKQIKANTKVVKFKRLMAFWAVTPLVLGYTGAALHMNGPFDFNFYPFLFFVTFYALIQLSSLRD
jgi:cellulose synthase/poly-beta-1,6-N-acetylglucosamine synthase-like glycosyltransferase